MTKRYYKATDGTFTIFRATDSRVYKGAWMTVDRARQRGANEAWEPVGEPFPVNMGFSAKFGSNEHGPLLQVIQIGKGEYDALVLYKTARMEARRDELRKSVGQEYFHSASPRDSWVRNADLPAIVSGAVPPNAHRDIEWSE